MKNSEQNAEGTSVSPNIGNIMLGAGASSPDDVSNDELPSVDDYKSPSYYFDDWGLHIPEHMVEVHPCGGNFIIHWNR